MEKKSKKGLIIGLIAGIATVAIAVTTLVLILTSGKKPANKDDNGINPGSTPEEVVVNALGNFSSLTDSVVLPTELFTGTEPVNTTMTLTLNSLNLGDASSAMLNGMGLVLDFYAAEDYTTGKVGLTGTNGDIVNINIEVTDDAVMFAIPELFSGAYMINLEDFEEEFEDSYLAALLEAMDVDIEEIMASLNGSQSIPTAELEAMYAMYEPVVNDAMAVFEDLFALMAAHSNDFKAALSAKAVNTNVSLECGTCTQYQVTLDLSKCAQVIVNLLPELMDKDSFKAFASSMDAIAGTDIANNIEAYKTTLAASSELIISQLEASEEAKLNFDMYLTAKGELAKFVFAPTDEQSITFEAKGKADLYSSYEITLVTDEITFSYAKDYTKNTITVIDDGVKYEIVLDFEYKATATSYEFDFKEFSVAVDGTEIVSIGMDIASKPAATAPQRIENAKDLLDMNEEDFSNLLMEIQTNIMTLMGALGGM